MRPKSHPGTLRGLLATSLSTAEPDIGPIGTGDLRDKDLDPTLDAFASFFFQATGEDKFQWWLPGILCLVSVLILIGLSIFIAVKTRNLSSIMT